MRKLFTLLSFFVLAISVQAQYIPNSDFEKWENAGNTYQSSREEMRARPGQEPAYWEGSSINQKVSIATKSEELIFKSSSYNGSNAVKMQNKYVGAMGIGSNAPGFISFATPWVYAVMDVGNCDGGVYGGTNFAHRPDAIKGRFNRTGGTGELAHVVVYLWNGTFKSAIKSDKSNDVRDNVDRAIMGKESNLQQKGKRIASCDYTFASTNGWQEIVVPLEYNYDEKPTMMNVILSSGDYWNRGNIKDGSVLEADDVQFVYYSELASLKYNGKEYFSKGNTSYTIDEVYNPEKLLVTSNGRGALIENKLDYNTNVLTVAIKGGDYALNKSNVHEYTIKFKKADSELASLVYKDKNYFLEGSTTFNIDEYYDANALQITSNGDKAVIDRTFDASTSVLTITIKGEDYDFNPDSKHVYTVNFRKSKSELTSLVYNGVEYFKAEATSFSIDEVYNPGKLKLVANSDDATIESVYDASSCLLTITVKGGDYALNSESKHVYIVRFKPDPGVAYSELMSLLYRGKEYYKHGKKAYVIDEVYNPKYLKVVSNGNDASIELDFDTSSSILTITIKGRDIEDNPDNKHIYLVAFNKESIDPAPVPAPDALLSGLEYNGKNYFVEGEKSFAIDEYYDETLLNVTVNQNDAIIEKRYDEETAVLTITVKGVDYAENYSNIRDYKVEFKRKVLAPELTSLVYAGKDYFAVGETSFVINEYYNESLLQLTASEENAVIEKMFNRETAVLTITLKRADSVESDSDIRVYNVKFNVRPFAPELTSLVYDGKDYYIEGQYEYTIDADYDRGKLEITLNVDAVVKREYDSSSKLLTVTLKDAASANGEIKETVYTVQFNNPVVEGSGLGVALTSIADADVNKTYVLYNEAYTAYAVYNPSYSDRVWVAGMRGGDQDHQVKNSEYSAPLDTASVNCAWKVVKHGNGKYSLYNVGAGKYLTTPEYEKGTEKLFACSLTSDAVELSVVELGNGNFAFNATNIAESYMCAAPQLDAPVSVWESSDTGSAWKLIENYSIKPGEVDYTPAYTGVKSTEHTERLIKTITLNSGVYADEAANVLNVDNSGNLCYNDYTEAVTMKAALGEELSLEVNIGEGSWIHSYLYIDSDENGFTASIAGDGYSPLGDLVSYSFYNNGGDSDEKGCNSEGTSIEGSGRSSVVLPSFEAPSVPGVYRVRVKIDWCNIDPMGDSDGKFNDFMHNGGQIVDFMLEVVDEEVITDIEEVDIEEDAFEEPSIVKGIYDMQGRKLDEITEPGMYIIDGKKVYVRDITNL